MSDLKAKMHQIRFWLALRPDHAGGAYNATQTFYLDLRGLLVSGGMRRGGERERGEERG